MLIYALPDPAPPTLPSALHSAFDVPASSKHRRAAAPLGRQHRCARGAALRNR